MFFYCLLLYYFHSMVLMVEYSKIGSKRSVREYDIDYPTLFSPPLSLHDPPPASLFLTEISLSGEDSKFGLLTRLQIPPFCFDSKIQGIARGVKLITLASLRVTPLQYSYLFL